MTVGLTLDEIAAATGVPVWLLDEVLDSERRRGHVQVEAGRWTLTATTERRLGAALRAGLDRPTPAPDPVPSTRLRAIERENLAPDLPAQRFEVTEEAA